MERAGRDAENRGVRDAGPEDGRKRRRVAAPGAEGLLKGEAPFLKAADDAGVRVVRAPRGMSRSKGNLSRWFAKYVWSLILWGVLANGV